MKRTLTVKQLVEWAYRQELPKDAAGQRGGGVGPGAGSAWSMVSDYAALGTLIDVTNAFGVVPGFVAEGEPHADALRVAQAVGRLIGDIDVPEGWRPFPGWDDPHGLIAASVTTALERWSLKGADQRRRHLTTLVVRSATLGRGPDWTADEPKTRMVTRGGRPAWFVMKTVTDAFGKEYTFETVARDRKARHRMPGAYRKYELSHDVVAAAQSRLDHQLWVSALESIQADLEGRLESCTLSEFAMRRAPWRVNADAHGV